MWPCSGIFFMGLDTNCRCSPCPLILWRATFKSLQQCVKISSQLSRVLHRCPSTFFTRLVAMCAATSSRRGIGRFCLAERDFVQTKPWVLISPCCNTAYTADDTPDVLASPKTWRVTTEIGWRTGARARGMVPISEMRAPHSSHRCFIRPPSSVYHARFGRHINFDGDTRPSDS